MNPFPHNFITIEGNIGVGKTTLCEILQERYNAKLILEQFTDNPFLPYFYQDPDRYAFPVELFFMTERHKQLQTHLSQPELFSQFTIADYFFIKTLLFARNNLNAEEYRLFQRLFDILKSNFPKPDLIVFLHRPIEELMENIKRRNRSYEQEITAEYLKKIQDTYYNYFRVEQEIPILIIDISKLDYLKNKDHLNKIIDAIGKTYPPGINHTSFV